MEPVVEYRPSLARTLAVVAGYLVATTGGVWMAMRPAATPTDRLAGLACAGLFGAMAVFVLWATIRHRACLRLDARGLRMVDRLGRTRLDVPWSSVANAYEAKAGRHDVVVLVASDLPANLDDRHGAPTSLTGPDGEALGYGYVVAPSIVDVRAPDLIAQVRHRLQGRLGEWEPSSAAPLERT